MKIIVYYSVNCYYPVLDSSVIDYSKETFNYVVKYCHVWLWYLSFYRLYKSFYAKFDNLDGVFFFGKKKKLLNCVKRYFLFVLFAPIKTILIFKRV